MDSLLEKAESSIIRREEDIAKIDRHLDPTQVEGALSGRRH